MMRQNPTVSIRQQLNLIRAQRPLLIPPEVDLRNIRNHPVRKRSILLRGHKTAMSLEDPFWYALRTYSRTRAEPANQIIAQLDDLNPLNLSSASRLFVLEWVRAQARKEMAESVKEIMELKRENARLRGIGATDAAIIGIGATERFP
jgi:predicted DNA-binding ribbon-helix-helix protein